MTVSTGCHATHELKAAKGNFYCECGLHVRTCRCLTSPTTDSTSGSSSTSRSDGDDSTRATVDLSLSAAVSSSSRSYSEAQAADVVAAVSADCARTGRPWVDPSFPHSAASLFIDPAQPHQPSWLEAEWVRVGSVVPLSALFTPPMTADDIRQGRLGNCWFLSALAVLTLRQSLVFACFVSPTEQPSGVYAVRFFRDGQQRVVVVDDFIPAMQADSGGQQSQTAQWQPLFAQQREGGHSVWSLIIEKGHTITPAVAEAAAAVTAVRRRRLLSRTALVDDDSMARNKRTPFPHYFSPCRVVPLCVCVSRSVSLR